MAESEGGDVDHDGDVEQHFYNEYHGAEDSYGLVEPQVKILENRKCYYFLLLYILPHRNTDKLIISLSEKKYSLKYIHF